MLNLTHVVNEMKQQRERLDSAIQALEGLGSVDHAASSRKLKRKGSKGVRKMSAAARRRISAGMKARWKKAKKAGRSSL